MNLKSIFGFVFGVVVGVILTTTVVVNAGTLVSPAASPVDTESYTLADIYHSLNSGQAAEKSTFAEPEVNPGDPTMFSLDEIYELTRERAPIRKTGQTFGIDHDVGVTWPNPRFTDNGNGTITDNLTGLIWLKDANCFEENYYVNAELYINLLESGECDLLDGSKPGDWRLPNLLEMQSLIHYGQYNPAIPNTEGTGKWQQGDPFDNVQFDNNQPEFYWTSTRRSDNTIEIIGINFGNGLIKEFSQIDDWRWFVLPVRGGQ